MNEESSDVALEALTDFLNAVEAGISAARQTIKNAKKIDEEKKKIDAQAFILPSDLTNLVTIETQEKQLVIRPKGFIGSEPFGKLSKLVTASHGYYISQGKSSHFVVPKPR